MGALKKKLRGWSFTHTKDMHSQPCAEYVIGPVWLGYLLTMLV